MTSAANDRDKIAAAHGWHRLTHEDPVIQQQCEREAGGPCYQHNDGRTHVGYPPIVHPVATPKETNANA